MDTFEKQYRFKEKELLCYINSILLSELIFLNYSFSNKEYNGISGKEIWKILSQNTYFQPKKKIA